MNNASAESINEIKIFALNLRKKILDMSLIAGADSSHFGGALSIVEIVSVLFSDIMRINKNNPLWEGRDRLRDRKHWICNRRATTHKSCESEFVVEIKCF